MITNLISVKDFSRENVIYYIQKAENIENIETIENHLKH